MKGLYWTGILLLYFYLVLGDGQQDCLVDDVYKKEHWSGEEMTFYTYVSDNDVVNIKITYKFLDETDYFTTFYFSPSKKYSKRIETKHGEELHHFPLTTMNEVNEWIEFRISSEKGTIQVFYTQNTHEQMSLNQTSKTFKDLIIRASNISFCEHERKWQVSEEKHQTIPLGREEKQKTFPVEFYPLHNIKPVLRIFDRNESISSKKISLVKKKTLLKIKSSKDPSEDVELYGYQNVSTIDISSKQGSFTVTVSYRTDQYLSSTTTNTESVQGEENCPTCKSTTYIAIIVLMSIVIIISIIVGLGFWCNIFHLRETLVKLLLKSKRAYQLERDFIRNKSSSADEENNSLERIISKENKHPTVDINQDKNYEEVPSTETQVPL